MAISGAHCAFCGAARPLVETGVLDAKWSSRFGGTAVVALDHGWYRSAGGQHVAADHLGGTKHFRPSVRACCDFCVNGWIMDLRWRAEPALLDLAERRSVTEAPTTDLAAVTRWAQLTAMLVELVPGMPVASGDAQRHAMRRGRLAFPATGTWLFTLRQRLPARVHLSQVSVRRDGAADGLVQIVSVDVAHFSALVVISSDERAERVVAGSALSVEFGEPREGASRDEPVPVHQLDLVRTPHPHQVAVQRLCAMSEGVPDAG